MTLGVLLVTAVVSAAQIFLVAPVGAASSPPGTWEKECGAARLGLDKVAVDLAEPQASDTKSGKRVAYSPDSRGRYTPVIMIHGWTGRSVHPGGSFSDRIDLTANRLGKVSTSRSLIGQLQDVPGAAVFTFDYHPYSARWVDDPHLGPALGKVIDCLYRVSGQKVILVGHSMGGLVARYAATQAGSTAADRGDKISTVVTFGTPNTGSMAAMLVAAGLNVGGPLQAHLAVVRAVLASCGALSTQELETGSLCDSLIPVLRAFSAQAGVALRSGSKELAQLRPWPKSIDVDALAGGTTFEVPTMSWFDLPWNTTSVPVGDVVVTRESAVHSADQNKVISCAYQLNAVRGATDSLGLMVGLVSAGETADVPLKAFSGPCFHGSLMRSIELTNEALGAVADDIDSRQPVTLTSLRSAPVPASCQHPAGRLKNGRLPGIPQGEGEMGLAWVMYNRSAAPYVALGDLNGDGTSDAAATLYCHAGGVSWPELVAFYAPGPRLLGYVDLSTVHLPGRSRGSNTAVSRLQYVKGAVVAEWTTQQDAGDPNSVSSIDYTATLRWNGSKVVASNLTATTEQGTVDSFLNALRRGDRETAARYTTAIGWVVEAVTQFDLYPEALAETPVCYGVNGDLPTPVKEFDSPSIEDAARLCLLPTNGGSGQYVVIGMSHIGFKQWRVSALLVV